MRPGRWCADSPHHITSIFYPVKRNDPLKTGSLGVGLAVEPRLRGCSENVTYDNPIVNRVSRLYGLSSTRGVELVNPLPHSVGYAVSAATAIVSSLVIGRSINYGYSEAMKIAHLADLYEGTGLGDVLALSCGVGVVLRKEAGAPGEGEVECLQLPGTLSIVSVETGVMTTRTMLENMSSRVYELAKRALNRLAKEFTIEEFLSVSTWFSKESGMLNSALGGRELPVLRGVAGIYGKKKVVVLIIEREWLHDAIVELSRTGYRPRILEASTGPPRIWWS